MTLQLRHFWYIACASSRLRSKPVAVRVLDEDIVLFRDGSGAVHALSDWCCHRGTRLSLGSVCDGMLACKYHGWRYDGNGQCTHIPSLLSGQEIPANCRIRAFTCQERDGYIWAWMGDADSVPAPLQGIPGYAERRWVQGSVAVQAASSRMIENNLDWCHPFFAHEWTHGQFFATRFRGFTEQAYETRVDRAGLHVFAPATRSEDEPIPERPTVVLRFQVPDYVRVDISKPFRMTICMHFVPVGEASCRLEWLVTRLLPFGSRVRWSDREPVVFRQDRLIVESGQARYNREGVSFEHSVEADASTLIARRLIDLAARDRWREVPAALHSRRIVRVRA